jgi:hypothetical protein
MEKHKYIKYLEKENSNLKQIIEKSLTLEELIINYEDYKKLKKKYSDGHKQSNKN